MTQVDDHVKIRLISQLIKGIVRVLQKLLKHFTGNAISISFAFTSAGVFPVILTLKMNDSEFGIVAFGSSLILP